MQPSRQFLSGLSPADISRVQHRLLGEIRAGQTGANDPETVLARVTENLRQRDSRETSDRLLKQLVTYPGEALSVLFRDIDHEKLLPAENRGARHERRRTIVASRSSECGADRSGEAAIRRVDDLVGRRTHNQWSLWRRRKGAPRSGDREAQSDRFRCFANMESPATK